MSTDVSKNIQTALIGTLLLALGTFTYQSVRDRGILFEKLDHQQREVDSLRVFIEKGGRFTKKDGNELKGYVIKNNTVLANLQARISSIESKKILSREEYKQFIEFMKIRFSLLEKKLDNLKDTT